MFSIQKWFARDDRFFRLLQASAEEGRASVQALRKILQDSKADPNLAQFAAARRKDKQITEQITELLARTSITSLDREDIEAISRALYRIPKTVEKFAARYVICAPHLGRIDFSAQISLVEQAINTVALMIEELEGSHFERVNQANEKLQTIEGDADKLVPIYQSQSFVKRCEAVGSPVNLIVREGKVHGWPHMEKDMELFADWFDKYLLGKSAKP